MAAAAAEPAGGSDKVTPSAASDRGEMLHHSGLWNE